MMEVKKERLVIVIAGLIIGVTAAALVVLGNPANMGFCIACFLRDISGALGLHQAAAVQYIRPEIPGLVLGSFAAGAAVGALAQRTRLCMVGGIRDLILFREPKLILGFAAIFAAALAGNLALGSFTPGFAGQPVAHTDGLWNALGMFLTGYGCVLLGGCPLRQLVLSGEGNADSAAAVLGLMVGAAFAHNFGLASSGAGPTGAGKIAVVAGIAVVSVLACVNTFGKKQ